MSVAAIPLYLLKQSAQLVTEYKADKWGKGLNECQELTNIRIEPCHGVRHAMSDDRPEIKAKLFFEDLYSKPAVNPFKLAGDTNNIGVVERQKVIFMGKEYLVSEVKFIFDDDSLHHLEVMLS